MPGSAPSTGSTPTSANTPPRLPPGSRPELIGEVGELVVTEPMPSMPVYFWNDPGGARLREAYFEDYPGVWRHGDWVRVTDRGSFVIYGRSDATLNCGGVRMGTAEFYAVVEVFASVDDSLVIDTSALNAASGSGGGELLCFLVLAPGSSLRDVEPSLRSALRTELSPRHVPDRFLVIEEVPRTLNGKKCEVPVKKILTAMTPENTVSQDPLRNPNAPRPEGNEHARSPCGRLPRAMSTLVRLVGAAARPVPL